MRRSCSQFDPNLVQTLCDHGAEIFDGLADVGTWQSVIDAEPALAVVLSGSAVDRALQDSELRRVGTQPSRFERDTM